MSLTGSGNYEMQQQLTDHHLRLLRMRTSAHLEGIEVGPEIGRGSYGRVYKGANLDRAGCISPGEW